MKDGGRSVHELEKSCRRLDMEKDELQRALEEACWIWRRNWSTTSIKLQSRADAEKNIKNFQVKIREDTHTGGTASTRAEACEAFQNADRRANLLAVEIKELRTQLHAVERAWRKCSLGSILIMMCSDCLRNRMKTECWKAARAHYLRDKLPEFCLKPFFFIFKVLKTHLFAKYKLSRPNIEQ